MFPQIFGKYVLERPLAVGGMAKVFLATLRGAGGFEKKLVVKQIRAELATDEAFVGRFVDEAKTTVELSHPNIVPVYEFGVEQGVYYLAMELCDGVTLAELLEQTGRLAPAEGAYVGVEICRALDYAHRRARIIHRDVTPRNVLVDEEGAVRLIDFGIAAPSNTEAGEVFGSPGHMPPEQLAGQELGPATDVFAVATLLYEVWSNRAPFRRESAEESRRALFEPVASASTIDRALGSLDALVASALAPDPAHRPQSAEDFSRPLRRFLDDADVGDVARRLGARVRAAREGCALAAAPGESELAAPSNTTTSVTRTFATRALDATPPLGPAAPIFEIATRRIAEDLSSWSTREDGAAKERARRRRPRLASAAVLVTIVLAAVIGWQAWRRVGAVTVSAIAIADPPLDPATSSAPAPNLTAQSPGSAAFIALAPAPPAEQAPPLAPATDAPSALAPILAQVSASPRSEKAGHLRVTATPQAAVEVDGRARGATPMADLSVSPGSHLVRLTCGALGEAVSQTLHVEPGEELRVSGDFTGARGRILVRRGPASP